MKTQKTFLTLALILAFTACSNGATTQNPVSDETITAALDGDKEAVENSMKENQTEEENQVAEAPTDPNAIDYDKWRTMIVEIGEFSPTLANNLSEEQLQDLILNAREVSEQTGYWDVKDFVFQDLGKNFPELSNKFPLQSVEDKYSQRASEEGVITGKYEYERRLMADWGYPSGEVWSVYDKTMEDAFHEAYQKDEELLYEDYVRSAANIMFGVEEEEDEEATNQRVGSVPAENNRASNNTTKKNIIRRFGSSQVDYDALKTSLVQYYEFKPSVVNQMTNEDIDIAYTRAMARLQETGFGDIGLIFDELGKMFPGASTMYPGDSE